MTVMDIELLKLLLELEQLAHRRPTCTHRLRKVKIYGRHVYAGPARAMTPGAIASKHIQLFVPLSDARVTLPGGVTVRPAPLPDFGGVTCDWQDIVYELAAEIDFGTIVLCGCTGGHGRTGTLLASLIAVMEPEIPDPIAAVRKRYCGSAVETIAQGQAIFDLRGEELPAQYRQSLIGL